MYQAFWESVILVFICDLVLRLLQLIQMIKEQVALYNPMTFPLYLSHFTALSWPVSSLLQGRSLHSTPVVSCTIRLCHPAGS